MIKLAVLISGSGSNLQAIIDAIEAGQLDAKIALVLSNKANAYGLERAQQHGIPAQCIAHRNFSDRASFDQAMQQVLEPLELDYLVLAGFMRILTPEFIRHFEHRILNIHPSLLPRYPGLHTHRRALENGDSEHGVSIHLVTEVLDDGPLLMQGSYPVQADDTEDSLAQRGHKLEHLMYPRVLQLLATGDLNFKQGQPYFHDAPLQRPLTPED